MRGKVIKLCRILYRLKQASQQWHNHLLRGMRGLGFEQCGADAFLTRLVEGAVSIVVVVHVDDSSSMGPKSRCDKFLCGSEPVRSYQQHEGVAMMRKMSIVPRLGCRSVDDITADYG